MLWDRDTRQKPTVIVTVIGAVGLIFALVYLFASPDFRSGIERKIEETLGANVEVIRHKESGEYFARLPGGRLVRLSGQEEANAVAEHGLAACESCE